MAEPERKLPLPSLRCQSSVWYDKAYSFAVPLTAANMPGALAEQFVGPLSELYEVVVGLE